MGGPSPPSSSGLVLGLGTGGRLEPCLLPRSLPEAAVQAHCVVQATLCGPWRGWDRGAALGRGYSRAASLTAECPWEWQEATSFDSSC